MKFLFSLLQLIKIVFFYDAYVSIFFSAFFLVFASGGDQPVHHSTVMTFNVMKQHETTHFHGRKNFDPRKCITEPGWNHQRAQCRFFHHAGSPQSSRQQSPNSARSVTNHHQFPNKTWLLILRTPPRLLG